MRIVHASCASKLCLGRLGESEVTKVVFSLDEFAEFPTGGEFVLLNQRPTDPAAYPVAITETAEGFDWIPTSSDLAKEGAGRCELVYYLGDAVAKSIIFQTLILPALDGSGETPEPWQSWVDAVHEDAKAAEAAAERAEQAAVHEPTIIEDVWFVWDVESGEYVSTGIHATGADGFSPTVTVEEIPGGHRVTITDADGPHVFDVMDGSGGGSSDYSDLSNKPQINGVTLSGNQTGTTLGVIDAPSSPATGAFLVWDGSAWVAQTLSVWQGGDY